MSGHNVFAYAAWRDYLLSAASAEVTVTIPLDTGSARLNAAIACGYPDWQALLDAAPEPSPAASPDPAAP